MITLLGGISDNVFQRIVPSFYEEPKKLYYKLFFKSMYGEGIQYGGIVTCTQIPVQAVPIRFETQEFL